MKIKYVSVAILTALLLCVMLLGGIWEELNQTNLTAVITVDGNTEEITLWSRSYRQSACVYLPGYAQMSQVSLKAERAGLYEINGVPLNGEMSCKDFVLDQRYPLAAAEDAALQAENIKFLRSEGVGALFLDVQSGNMDYIESKKGNSEIATMRLYDINGQLNYSGDVDEVSGRGQSTWLKEKKSYNMVLSREADLLGMGTAGRWVLQANNTDTTNIRNKMIFDYAAEAGIPYTPQSQWVDLYLNGEYAGLYLLCERIEIHPERVAIPQTGSFLVTKDWQWRFERDGNPYIMTQSQVTLGIRHADMSSDELLAIWQSVENAILAEDGIDPVTGKSWQELIDMESWVNKILIEEIFGNSDGVALSQYFYLDGSREDGRICAGPVWDYDLTMHREPNQLHINKGGLFGSPWYHALFQKEEFMDRLRYQYIHVFRPLLQELVNGGMAEYADYTAVASNNNADRWEYYDVQEEVAQMQVYMQQRMALLDYIWVEQGPYVTVQIFSFDGGNRVYALKPGESLPSLPEAENCVWFYENTNEPVDAAMPVYENLRLHQMYVKPEQDPEEADQAETADPERLPVRRWAPVAVLCIMGLTLAAADFFRQRNHTEKRSGSLNRKPEGQPIGKHTDY